MEYTKKVMCNWSPHCDLESCPHKTPHYPKAGRNHPNCIGKNIYCFSKKRPVECVPIVGCGCIVAHSEIIYCLIHKAAPTMYKALRFIPPRDMDKLMPSTQWHIKQALIEAKGGK